MSENVGNCEKKYWKLWENIGKLWENIGNCDKLFGNCEKILEIVRK